RAGKRQAAPHSRGELKANPKPPGRKAGRAYGRRACRPIPPRLDERIDVALPKRCPRCGGGVEVEQTAPQCQEEIVRPTVARRGGLYRALARMANQATPSYRGLVRAARQSLVNSVDETGWKVGGRLQWLHVAVSAEVTVYAIRPGRGYEQAREILGADYEGFLVHDGWAPYYRFR